MKIKVNFCYGNNEIYDYYLVDKKSEAKEIEINKNSLAYRIGGFGKYKVSKYGEFPFGNFDYLLEIYEKKGNNFRGLKLVSEDEIEKI